MAAVRLTPSLLLLVLAVLGVRAKLPLPPYVKPCSIKDAKAVAACAKERVPEIMPYVMEGDSKYDIPPLDPLRVQKIVVDDGSGPLGLYLAATDIRVHGLRGLKVDNIVHGIDPQEDIYEATIPELLINLKYNMSGTLLIPINGFGDGVLSMTNAKIVYRFKWHLAELEDGEIYYLPRPGAHLDVDVENLKMNYDNLFNGDKLLGETTNKFMNENWRMLFDVMRPVLSDAISDIITRMIYGIYSKVPYKDAFLDTGY